MKEVSPGTLAFLFSGSPQSRNKDKTYLHSWKTAEGGGGRGDSRAKGSSINLPFPLLLGSDSPCSRVRPSRDLRVQVPYLRTSLGGRIWGGRAAQAPPPP